MELIIDTPAHINVIESPKELHVTWNLTLIH